MAIDYVLPEITTCYQVPFVDSDDPSRTAYELPVTQMVSSGSQMYLFIYAYGAYIDLKKSTIELTIGPAACTGLVLSCDSIHSDGFIEIGSASVVSSGVELTEHNFSFGKLLKARINGHGSRNLQIDITVCTNKEDELTTITVVPHLISSAPTDVYSGNCLFLQINPYRSHVDKICSLTEKDWIPYKPLDYDIYIQEPKSVHCSGEPLSAESRYFEAEGMEAGGQSSTKLLSPDKNKFCAPFI